jgi:hypothetical protein
MNGLYIGIVASERRDFLLADGQEGLTGGQLDVDGRLSFREIHPPLPGRRSGLLHPDAAGRVRAHREDGGEVRRATDLGPGLPPERLEDTLAPDLGWDAANHASRSAAATA